MDDEVSGEPARFCVEVTAGVVPGTPDPVHTRRFWMTSREWNDGEGKQAELLAEANGRALGYAAMLMGCPHALNWVKTQWVWF